MNKFFMDENVEDLRVIHNNVRSYRVYKGLTQRELAKQIGICLTLVQKIEHQYCPKYQIQKKLSDFFGVSMTQLFFREDIE
jgi:DNA-binding XRE family transcriptional regulator